MKIYLTYEEAQEILLNHFISIGVHNLATEVHIQGVKGERKKSETISLAKGKLRENGKYQGGRIPFGYTRDGDELIPNEREQKAIEKAKIYRNLGYPYREIAERVNFEFNTNISYSGVRKILKGQRKTK